MIKGMLSPGDDLLRPLLSHRRMSFAMFKEPVQTGCRAKDKKNGYKWWIGHQRMQAAAHFLSIGGTSSGTVPQLSRHPDDGQQQEDVGLAHVELCLRKCFL